MLSRTFLFDAAARGGEAAARFLIAPVFCAYASAGAADSATIGLESVLSPFVIEEDSAQDNRSGGGSPASEAAQYVDLHAVILMDVSPSMKVNELQKAKEGIESYLLSDESLEDYRYGAAKAITVVSFSGGTHVAPTTIIHSEEAARDFIDNFIDRHAAVTYSGPTIIQMEDGSTMSGGTQLNRGMHQAAHVFRNEEAAGITSERRVALVIGDATPDSQKSEVRIISDLMTNSLGVQVCGISVSEVSAERPDYGVITTNAARHVTTEAGNSVYVQACQPVEAVNPEQVKMGVAHVLGMPRI
jgi:uncharacterized protein YegL